MHSKWWKRTSWHKMTSLNKGWRREGTKEKTLLTTQEPPTTLASVSSQFTSLCCLASAPKRWCSSTQQSTQQRPSLLSVRMTSSLRVVALPILMVAPWQLVSLLSSRVFCSLSLSPRKMMKYVNCRSFWQRSTLSNRSRWNRPLFRSSWTLWPTSSLQRYKTKSKKLCQTLCSSNPAY